MQPSATFAVSIQILETALTHPTTGQKLDFAEYRDPVSGKQIGFGRWPQIKGYRLGFQGDPNEEGYRTHAFDSKGKYIGASKNATCKEEARQIINAVSSPENFLNGRAA